MEAKFKNALIAFVLIGAACVAPRSQGAPWNWKYRVLHSAHFELIYHDEQKALAKRYIVAAEQAYELLMPIFKEGPSKTIIFLDDDTDSANGSAAFLPYAHIVVYPVLPNTLDSIDEFGDWPLEMMVHEYTHILNMHPAHGFYWPLKYIFGSVMRPNAVLPRWYLEGLAVNLETALTDFGRLRSTDSQASARALALENKLRLEDIGRIGESSIPTWPFGSRPYVYGGWWWETVQKEKGFPVIETWNQNFSRRLPFLLNGPMREQTGKSATEILNATAQRLEQETSIEIEAIKAAGVPKANVVNNEAGEQSVFALSPSGNQLFYFVGTTLDGNQARLKVRTNPTDDFNTLGGLYLFKGIGPTRVRWIDEQRVIFDQLNYKSPAVNFRDLYIADLKANTVKAITKNLRAQEASPSPSGKEAVFIKNDGGRNAIGIINLETEQHRLILRGNFNQRLSGPEYLNEKEIVFALRERSGEETLRVYNTDTRQVTPFNTTLKNAQNPRRIPGGLLVSDSTTGVRNIYWLHDGKTEPVSNTLTAIENADYDPHRKELIFSEMTADGRRLRAIPLAAQKPPTLDKPDWPKAPPISTAKVPIREESYQPIEYMRPRYWIPFLYQVEGGFIAQGITSTQDPAGRNEYSLNGSFDTVTKKTSYGAAYTNYSLPTAIGLNYGKSYSYLGASGLIVESQAAGLNFSQNWPWESRDTSWSLGGNWIDTAGTARRLGPNISWQHSALNRPENKWYGYFLRLSHSEYLGSKGYLGYGRSFVHMTNTVNFGGGHRLTLQSRAAFAPKMPFSNVILLGDRNVGGNYVVNLANSEFLLRGYPSGEFVGRKILNGNLEYTFPAKRLDRGFGTFPLFMQAIEVAAFADVMAVEGAGFDPDIYRYVRRNLGQFFPGAGTELRFNTTAAYHMPVSFTLGLYYGFDQRFGGGFAPFFGLGLGDIGSLQDKKH